MWDMGKMDLKYCFEFIKKTSYAVFGSSATNTPSQVSRDTLHTMLQVLRSLNTLVLMIAVVFSNDNFR